MAQIDSPHDAPSEQSEGREINPMEARLQQAQLEYLEAQRDVLRNQISTAIARRETLRTVASMLSALSVVVGLFALAWTVWQGLSQLRLQQQERLDTQIQDAVRGLVDEKTNRRLSALTVLRIALHKSQTRQQEILSSIAYAMATENDSVVRDSMNSLIASLSATEFDHEALAATLADLAQVSRSLVEGENLREMHGWLYQRTRTDSAESRVQSVSDAIVALLRLGARRTDLHGIYCANCKLTGLDLSGVDLRYSILAFADLSKANMRNALLGGADLEHSKFRGADLAGASIVDESPRGYAFDSYAERRLKLKLGSFGGPDFSCANLAGADFSGQALFFLVAKETGVDQINLLATNFNGANLSGAKLRELPLLVVAPENHDYFPFSRGPYGSAPGGAARPGNPTSWREPLRYRILRFGGEKGRAASAPDGHVVDPRNQYASGLAQISQSFANSNWRDANLDSWLTEWLKANEPSNGKGLPWARPCQDDIVRTK